MKKLLWLSVLWGIAITSLPAAIITDGTKPFRVDQRIGFNKTCHDGTLRPNCVWDWGDDTSTPVINDSNLGWIYHVYKSPGTYQVRYERSSFIGAAGAPQCGGTSSWSESFVITIDSLPDQVNVLLAELTLDNGKSYKVVPKGSRNIQGILRMKMEGTGIVSGYWLVDGHPFEFFDSLSHQGEIKTIQTKALPGLPTIQPGLHTLTVKLTRPKQGMMVFPVLKYVVLPYANTVVLINPVDGFVAKETEKPEFSWQPVHGASRYQIAFADESQRLLLDTPSLVWLDTQERTSTVADEKTWQTILRNRPAYWKVRALDSLGNVLAESMVRKFKIIVPSASLTFSEMSDLDGNPLAIDGQRVHSKNLPILVKGRIQYMGDAEYLILRVFVNQTLSDQLVIRDYRRGESRPFETSLAAGPGNISVEFQVLQSSSPSLIIGSEHLLLIRDN